MALTMHLILRLATVCYSLLQSATVFKLDLISACPKTTELATAK
jgi:hypothetical protein